jgi:uncharacterized Zn finger protein (UPF0148 family)
LLLGGIKIKRENCPFCGHRWVRSLDESPIKCPNCKMKFYDEEQLAEKRHAKNNVLSFIFKRLSKYYEKYHLLFNFCSK